MQRFAMETHQGEGGRDLTQLGGRCFTQYVDLGGILRAARVAKRRTKNKMSEDVRFWRGGIMSRTKQHRAANELQHMHMRAEGRAWACRRRIGVVAANMQVEDV